MIAIESSRRRWLKKSGVSSLDGHSSLSANVHKYAPASMILNVEYDSATGTASRSDRLTMSATALGDARAAKGFMPDDEGLALHAACVTAGASGRLLEIGRYRGKSAVYLGASAKRTRAVLFTIDRHHGSEENQAGWEH